MLCENYVHCSQYRTYNSNISFVFLLLIVCQMFGSYKRGRIHHKNWVSVAQGKGNKNIDCWIVCLIRCLSFHEYPILMNTPSQFHLNKGRVGKGAGGMLSFVSAGKSCTRYICKKTCTVLLKLCSCDVGDLAIWFISTDTCVVASFWYYSIAQATMFVLWCMNNWFMIYTEKSNDNLYTILECTERCIVLLMLAMILYEENVFFLINRRGKDFFRTSGFN